MYHKLLFGLAILATCVFAFPSHLSAMAQENSATEDGSAAEVSQESDLSGDSAETSKEESGSAAHDGDHGEHGHVDTDPTHANISDATWEVVDFRTDMAFFSGVVFLLLLGGLYATAWKPILSGLEKREETIADSLANAERAAEAAEEKLAEYEAKLAEANEEATEIVAEARRDAEATGQKIVAAAQEEAVKLKERATNDIESAKRVALGELAEQSTQVAMSVAERVVGREVKADDHQNLIQELLSKLPSKN